MLFGQALPVIHVIHRRSRCRTGLKTDQARRGRNWGEVRVHRSFTKEAVARPGTSDVATETSLAATSGDEVAAAAGPSLSMRGQSCARRIPGREVFTLSAPATLRVG